MDKRLFDAPDYGYAGSAASENVACSYEGNCFVKHQTDTVRALIETFRATGGERIICFRRGRPRLPPAEAAVLVRRVRRGRIRRHASGDFGWVSYRLHEWAGDATTADDADALL